MHEHKNDIKGFISSSKTPDADKEIYRKLYVKAQALLEKGQRFLEKKENLHPLDQEGCYFRSVSGSTLHRGFYCPSPVQDIIVGNRKRGKLLRRETKRSNVSHRYVFNKDSELLSIDNLYNGNVFATEHLQRRGSQIYGFTIDKADRVYAVSEELYHDDVLEHYTVVYYLFVKGTYSVTKTYDEHYRYNEQGLCECDYLICDYPIGHIQKQTYRFVCQDGYLISYCAIENNNTASQQYIIEPSRKV